jgi:hypothetical protein
MSDEQKFPLPENIEEAQVFPLTAEALAEAAKALTQIEDRSFAGRNPHLGKMVNCPVHGFRHRLNEFGKCEQKFTYRVGDYELYREDEKGELVPAYRTAIQAGEKPTMRQQVGAAAFAKKRFHPHYSKIKLLFIQRTREVFARMGFDLNDKETFERGLKVARVQAARELRAERKAASRKARLNREWPQRIQRGLERPGSRP